jgi:hypothetical protein
VIRDDQPDAREGQAERTACSLNLTRLTARASSPRPSTKSSTVSEADARSEGRLKEARIGRRHAVTRLTDRRRGGVTRVVAGPGKEIELSGRHWMKRRSPPNILLSVEKQKLRRYAKNFSRNLILRRVD